MSRGRLWAQAIPVALRNLYSSEVEYPVIRVNEKWDIPWQEGMTVSDVLAVCEFTHHHVVVSVNGTAVPPEQHTSRPVADGDRVQVIHIIGGG